MSNQLSCELDIPPPAEGETLDPGLVNARCRPTEGAEPVDVREVGGASARGPAGGWYDDEENPAKNIVFPVACEALPGSVGGSVEVLFDCETQVGPPN